MTLTHPAFTVPFESSGDGSAELQGDKIVLHASQRSDLFHPPGGGERIINALRLLLPPQEGDLQFLAHLQADLRSLFDAGALLLWRDAENWAKLALERDPAGRPTLVTVVTRESSDDANSWALPRAESWLRISRLGAACAFHASSDGHRWALVRHFALADPGPLCYGLLAQSPTGMGCTTRFDGLTLQSSTLEDVRSGS